MSRKRRGYFKHYNDAYSGQSIREAMADKEYLCVHLFWAILERMNQKDSQNITESHSYFSRLLSVTRPKLIRTTLNFQRYFDDVSIEIHAKVIKITMRNYTEYQENRGQKQSKKVLKSAENTKEERCTLKIKDKRLKIKDKILKIKDENTAPTGALKVISKKRDDFLIDSSYQKEGAEKLITLWNENSNLEPSKRKQTEANVSKRNPLTLILPLTPSLTNSLLKKNKKVNSENYVYPEKDAQKLIKLWNDNCGQLPKVKKINRDRIKKINKVQKELSESEWENSILNIASSDFCNGRTGNSTWRANFDWLLGKDRNGNLNAIKSLEGNYKNTKKMSSNELLYNEMIGDMFEDSKIKEVDLKNESIDFDV